jgi:hypothetical protein
MAQNEQGDSGKDGAGMKAGAGGKPQAYDAFGRYSGPTGGAVKTRDGSVRVFSARNEDGEAKNTSRSIKLAGADREAEKAEPKSLLSATREQLERIAGGTGQAVTQGAAGAGQALARTADELAHNEELHKGVEFGVKAAGEVSKDVWAKAGSDAISTAFGRFRPGAGEGVAPLPGAVGGLIWKGVSSFRKLPEQTRDLGERIMRTRDDVYTKE